MSNHYNDSIPIPPRDSNDPGGYEALPPGLYPCIIQRCELSANPGSSGYHFLIVEMEIVYGEKLDDIDESLIGRHVLDRLSLAPQAIWKFRDVFLKSLGIDASDGGEIRPSQLVRGKLIADVRNRTYQDRMQDYVHRYLPINVDEQAVSIFAQEKNDDDEFGDLLDSELPF